MMDDDAILERDTLLYLVKEIMLNKNIDWGDICDMFDHDPEICDVLEWLLKE
jgi:hypothetical protein